MSDKAAMKHLTAANKLVEKADELAAADLLLLTTHRTMATTEAALTVQALASLAKVHIELATWEL